MEKVKEELIGEPERFLLEYPRKINFGQSCQRAVFSSIVMFAITGTIFPLHKSLIDMLIVLPFFILVINGLSALMIYTICLYFAPKYPVLLILFNDKEIDGKLKLDETMGRLGASIKNVIVDYLKYVMFITLLIVLTAIMINLKPIPVEIVEPSLFELCKFGWTIFPASMIILNYSGGLIHLLLRILYGKIVGNPYQMEN